MDKVRIGVIGVGGMGQGHCSYLGPGQLDLAQLTAVCDIAPEVAREVGERYHVPHFLQHADLLDSGLADAVIIATPHYFHPPIAIDAFKRDIHVLTEKPIGVTVKATRQMIRAAERSGCTFAVMFQMRHQPEYQAAKKLIKQGRLGEIYRVSAILADYRSQAYYDSGGWRATWKGEGGGVLMNQAPHGMDIFTWLAGAPRFVTARTRTCLHQIEVEDQAFALLEYPNGAHGYLYSSTTDMPGSYRLEICGDKGKILLDETGIKFWEVSPPLCEFTVKNQDMWGMPEVKLVEVPLEEREQGHIAVTRNFCRAILFGDALVTPGDEGIHSLELADAIILSSYRRKTVRLPLNMNEYEELIEELKRKSKPKKHVIEQRLTDTRHQVTPKTAKRTSRKK